MSQAAPVLTRLWQSVIDARWCDAAHLDGMTVEAESLMGVLGDDAETGARRAAQLLAAALERLRGGVWPPSVEVRRLLGDCILAVARGARVAPFWSDDQRASLQAPAEHAERMPQAGPRVPDAPEAADAREDPGEGLWPEGGDAQVRLDAWLDAPGNGEPQAAVPTEAVMTAVDTTDPTDASGFAWATDGPASWEERMGELLRVASPEMHAVLLRTVAAHPCAGVRARAAAFLGGFRNPAAEAALRGALEDEHPLVRAAAVSALVRFGREAARAVLDRAVLDPDPGNRLEALLWRMRMARHIPAPRCPCLTETGLCDAPGSATAPDCHWERCGVEDWRLCAVWRACGRAAGLGDKSGPW